MKWQAQNNVLSFDFIDRAMVPAHSKNVAKVIKQNKALQKQEKEELAAFYSKSVNHTDMLELKKMAINLFSVRIMRPVDE